MTAQEILEAFRSEKDYLDISYRAMAKKSGYTPTTIRCWLDETNEPRLSSLVDLAETLDLEIVIRRRKE